MEDKATKEQIGSAAKIGRKQFLKLADKWGANVSFDAPQKKRRMLLMNDYAIRCRDLIADNISKKNPLFECLKKPMGSDEKE